MGRRYQFRKLPAKTRFRQWLGGHAGKREALEYEWSPRYDADARCLDIKFYIERVLVTVDLVLATKEPVHLDRMFFVRDDFEGYVDFGVATEVQDDRLLLRITTADREPIKKAKLYFQREVPEVGSRIIVKVAGMNQPDLARVRDAHVLAQAGDFNRAIATLQENDAAWRTNPTVSDWLSEWSLRSDKLDAAELYAVRAALHGNVDMCADRYREVQEKRTPRAIADVRELQAQAAKWSIGEHYGFTTVELRQEFRLGLNELHLKKCRHLVEIRRPAAARMVTELSFPFSASNEYMLFTKMRVIHGDDTVEDLATELFTVGDDEQKNIFITVEDEKVGHWILPDLEQGDLIEWEYHLLCRDQLVNNAPHTFVLAGLFDTWFPTFKGSVEFSAPQETPVRFLVRNFDCEERRSSVDGTDTVAFEANRFIPTRRTGFRFENNYLNPIIVCTTDGVSWSDVAAGVREMVVGESEADDELPEPLAGLVERSNDPQEALESAFCWIRDTLKYATTLSGVKNIGHADRARRIVESGVGNCNDKSYLLSLVCRRLGMPYDLVAISSKNGVLIDDAPADQFDHVFIRAKVADRDIYMDAANVMSVFGSAPAWCQGMKALVLDDAGSIVDIPVDEPEMNGIEIVEVFEAADGGRLHGRFEFRADGQCARFIDERWKGLSLNISDPQKSGQEALREYLPAAAVTDYTRQGAAGRFHVRGRHSRGPLATLGEGRGVVGTLRWETPFLPVDHLQTLEFDRLFVAMFPLRVRVEVRLGGNLRRHADAVSRVQRIEGPVCDISEEIVEDEAELTVCRSITFKKKFVRGEDVTLLPEVLERIGEALQLVVSIRAER